MKKPRLVGLVAVARFQRKGKRQTAGGWEGSAGGQAAGPEPYLGWHDWSCRSLRKEGQQAPAFPAIDDLRIGGGGRT